MSRHDISSCTRSIRSHRHIHYLCLLHMCYGFSYYFFFSVWLVSTIFEWDTQHFALCLSTLHLLEYFFPFFPPFLSNVAFILRMPVRSIGLVCWLPFIRLRVSFSVYLNLSWCVIDVLANNNINAFPNYSLNMRKKSRNDEVYSNCHNCWKLTVFKERKTSSCRVSNMRQFINSPDCTKSC